MSDDHVSAVITRRNLSREVLDHLLARIRSGEFPVGAWLPKALGADLKRANRHYGPQPHPQPQPQPPEPAASRRRTA